MNQVMETSAFDICNAKIAEYNLEMKLHNVKHKPDELVVYFTADKQLDFQNLAKDLYSAFEKRINFIQIPEARE